MKTCTRCKLSKPESEFDRVRKGDDTRRKNQCKDCIRRAKGHQKHPHAETIAANRQLVLRGRKICTVCHEEKPLDSFHNWTKGIGNRHPWCKTCVTRHDRMKKYSMTLEQVIAAEAITHCPGCGAELGTRGAKACFDHCHATGAFRMVLCERCNIAIGYVDNSSEILRRLAELLDGLELPLAS